MKLHWWMGGFLLLAIAACAKQDFNTNAATQLASGKLRTDVNPTDAPISAERLADTLAEIAFTYEISASGKTTGEKAKPLQRWTGDVRYQLVGNSVSTADKAVLESVIGRISKATNLQIFPQNGKKANFRILIIDEKNRSAVFDAMSKNFPKETMQVYRQWGRAAELPCIFQIFYRKAGDKNAINGALVIVKAEATPFLREVCLHEETAQAFGLLNDSFNARPSVFNDDQEFARLTVHDELLLAMLYDPRLMLGMSLDEARPLLLDIAKDKIEGLEGS